MDKKGAERHYKFIRIQTGAKEGQINNVVRVKRVHTVQFHSSLDSIKINRPTPNDRCLSL